jgi:hypothetical protein
MLDRKDGYDLKKSLRRGRAACSVLALRLGKP